MNDEDLEPLLKSMRWRSASPECLKSTLSAALAECQLAGQVSAPASAEPSLARRRSLTASLLAFIPKPLRLPLAACWLLALFFKLTTPDPISPQTRATIAQMPVIDPQLLFAKLEEEQRLTANLLAELNLRRHSPADPHVITIDPVLP